MRTTRILLAALLLGGAITVIPSCGKYEDGPGFSLMTKKARLVGKWDAVEYVDSDGTTTAENGDGTLEFEKDGTFSVMDDGIGFSGDWEFIDKKEKLRLSQTSGSLTFHEDYTIRRLTNKEFWLEDEDGDMTKYEAK